MAIGHTNIREKRPLSVQSDFKDTFSQDSEQFNPSAKNDLTLITIVV